MSTETRHKSDWIWVELMTKDQDASAKFYGDVIGWKMDAFPGPGPRYVIGMTGGRGIAGMLDMPQELRAHNVPPHWSGFLHVQDVDAKTKEAVALGATVHREPWDIPGVGRLSVMGDPEGATFCMMQPAPMERPLPHLPFGADGTVSWCELLADNWDAELGFYQKLFGWTRSDAMDMGPYGTYQMFSSNAEPMTGGTMKKMADGPMANAPTAWLYYFHVPTLAAAMDRVRAGGGIVHVGPLQVPGGSWIAQCTDPHGAFFALHSSEK